MATIVLVLGKSGTGKTRAISTLDPARTFLINPLAKDLPFRGWKSKFIELSKSNPTGNMLTSDNYDYVLAAYSRIATRDDVDTVIVDDFNYFMTTEFMRRSKEKGYEKFTEIADHAYQIIWQARKLRENQTVIFNAHTETNESTGEVQTKTIGKLLSEKVCIEGLFSIVLATQYENGKYSFLTQTDGRIPAKSPEGMFDREIPNDFSVVIDSINKYSKGE